MRRILLALASAGVFACGGGGDGGGTQPPPAAPAISLSTASATFSGVSGGTSPAPQSVSISNGGTGTLSGLAAGAITYGAGQPTGWLAASVSGTTAPITLTLTPTLGTLLAGTYTATVPVTSSATGVTNNPQVVSATFTVAAGAATHLAFTAQPAGTSGGAISPAVTVAIEDAAGNVVTSSTASVTIAFGANLAGATLGGTATVAAVAGVATFSNLVVSKTGTGFTLVASATGLTGATSAPFTVPAPATQLAFTVQPTSVTSGASIAPAVVVTVRDALGNTVTSATNSVTLAIGANPGSATLGGTTTVPAVGGLATFSNLTLSSAGTGYTLAASATGLTGATSSAFNVTSAVATVTLAAPGQSISFLTSPNFNTTLAVQPGSQYLIAVVNTDASNTIFEGFSLSASFGASAAAQQAPAAVSVDAATAGRASAAAGPTYAVTGPLPPSLAALRGLAQNHTGMLDANRQIFARFGNPTAAWTRARAQAGRVAPVSAAISQTVGTVNKVYVRKALSGSCTSVDSVNARTVAVGQHIIVLADTNRTTWLPSNRPDSSFYQTFANEYDQLTFPHILANIGNPLAYDAQLSGIGKITVTITPVLNNFAGGVGGGSIVAFVSGCDFFPYATSGVNADLSNQTEMFYSWVPGSNNFTVAAWEALLRATAAHETKHIVSYTDRIMNNSPVFEEIWLEEGLAQESSEIWERNFNQATWLGHANFLQTVACEIPLGANAPCDQANTKPYALLGSHLPFLFGYLQTESSSNGEGLGLDTPANYGAGWTIARWATDQYAGSAGEAGFIKSLINEPTLSGLANLSAHTGQSTPLLLVYWNLATAIFQTPAYTAADVRTTIPSFNLANIFNVSQAGLTCNGTPCGLFTSSGTPVYPIQPIAVSATGTFTRAVPSVPGTSASYFLLSGSTAGIETLQLLNASGGALSASSGFRVAILRVQ